MTDFFVSSLSGASARQAVVEQTGASAWLYMTSPHGEPPIGGCFLFATDEEQPPDSDAPPPVDPEFASAYRVALPVTEDDIAIVWSPKGDAVAARVHGEFVAFIGPADVRGYSRSVAEDCDWGHPFDVDLFNQLFRGE